MGPTSTTTGVLIRREVEDLKTEIQRDTRMKVMY